MHQDQLDCLVARRSSARLQNRAQYIVPRQRARQNLARSRPQDDVPPIDHEEITSLMNGTLRDFLDQHVYPGGSMQNMEFIRMRGVERDLRRLGFFLDEQLPDPKQMARCDLSTVVWLQIAEEVGDRLIVLNLDEFNNLVARALAEQYCSLSRVLQLKRISAEKLKEVAHIILRDPTGFSARWCNSRRSRHSCRLPRAHQRRRQSSLL